MCTVYNTVLKKDFPRGEALLQVCHQPAFLLRCNRAVFINPLIDQAGILALLDGFVDELKEVLVALRDCNSGILVANVLRKLRVTQNQIRICDKVRLCNSRLDNNAVCLIGGQLENGERDFFPSKLR